MASNDEVPQEVHDERFYATFEWQDGTDLNNLNWTVEPREVVANISPIDGQFPILIEHRGSGAFTVTADDGQGHVHTSGLLKPVPGGPSRVNLIQWDNLHPAQQKLLEQDPFTVATQDATADEPIDEPVAAQASANADAEPADEPADVGEVQRENSAAS
jgi:hypothetical protein